MIASITFAFSFASPAAYVDNDLVELRDLHDIFIVEFLHQSRSNVVLL